MSDPLTVPPPVQRGLPPAVLQRIAMPGSTVLQAWVKHHGPEARGLTPLAAAARKATGRRSYSGAQWGRTMADWIALSTSADAELFLSLRALRNRSRDLERNNEYAKHVFRLIANNVVGRGIGLEAQVPMRRGARLDNATNDRIEALWAKWGQARHCHTAARFSWSALQRAIIRGVALNGEVLLRMVRQPFGGSPVPFALEIIEADQLIDNWSGRGGVAQAPNGNTIRMGVEVDQWQRPVAYWLYPNHPGDNFVNAPTPSNQYLRVPADEIIHIALFERPFQTRGIPWMHATLVKLRHMGGYEEAEIIAARGSAAIMGFITEPEVDIDTSAKAINAGGSDDVQDGEAVYDLTPGIIKKLAPGETFAGFNPSRPNAAMDPFMRYMLRSVAAGVGVSYESLSRDYSQSNYSSSRLAVLDDRDNWRVLQQWFTEILLAPVYEAWLDAAVNAGALSLPAWEIDRDIYLNVRWMPRGWEWVDPFKEGQAARQDIRAGLATNASVLAGKGMDFDDLMRQRKRELDLAAELGIVLDTDPAQVNDKGAAQAATPAAGDGGDGASNPPAKE